MKKPPETKSNIQLINKAVSLSRRLVSFLENLKMDRRDSFLVLLFIIFLRNLLESQFEFPGFVGFVKVPVDSAFAFFIHFPLFYFTIFYTLYLVLSWLRGDREKAFNVLVPGFSVILIPPLFDYVVMGRSYHLSYFFEFEAYARGLIGVALPWLKDIGQVSVGQRIEVYLSNLFVFCYLLSSNRGIIRALVGFFATHFIIAGFGGLGILLTSFLQKNWLMFSHHQVFIQVFAVLLLLLYCIRHSRNTEDQAKMKNVFRDLAPTVAGFTGVLFCMKLRLPLAMYPFVYSSIISILIACAAAGMGFQKRNLIVALLCLCLAVSVRYESLIFICMLLIAVHIKAISRPLFIRMLLSGIAGIFALYAGSSIFFFYNAMSLTPVLLVVFVFIAGMFSCLWTKWRQLAIIYVAVILSSLLVPGRGSIVEHIKNLSAVSHFRKNDFAAVLAELKGTKATSLSNFLQGAALVNVGYAAEGMSFLENIDAREMDRNVVYAELAAFNQLGKLQNGVEVIDCGLRLGIMMDDLFLEKTRQLILKNELHIALRSLDSAYVLGAKKEDVMALAGDIIYRQGKFREAIKIYEYVRESDPAGYYAYGQEGLVYFSMGDHDRALQLLARALELNDKDAVVYNNYGVALRAAGRFSEARAAFMNAIRISPVFVDAFFNLGWLSFLENKNEEARFWYSKTLEVNPNFVPAKTELEKLTE